MGTQGWELIPGKPTFRYRRDSFKLSIQKNKHLVSSFTMIQSASIVADKKAVLEAFIESSGNGSAVEESQDLLEEALLAFKAATQSICPGLEPALAELKGFKSCPGGERGVKILSACSILLEKNNSVPDSLPRSWEACRNMIKCPRSFLARMKAFQPERITEHNASLVANILNDPECTYESVKRVSSGLAALRNWVANIYKYHCIYAKIKELIGVGPLGGKVTLRSCL